MYFLLLYDEDVNDWHLWSRDDNLDRLTKLADSLEVSYQIIHGTVVSQTSIIVEDEEEDWYDIDEEYEEDDLFYDEYEEEEEEW